MLKPVHIVGGGLAGSETAFFLARRNIPVVLHEMRPSQMTEAHQTDRCAELVCSNTFKSNSPETASGALKMEMRGMGSVILETADQTTVPAGEALAVDRDRFAEIVTQKINDHPLITRQEGVVDRPFEDAITVFATGPLTANSLAKWIQRETREDDLYFYDAIAPIVDAQSIDPKKSFLANRYDKGGEEAYLNCPMDKEEYDLFIDALVSAEKVTPKNFEKEIFFQGCQPIEAIANGGRESLRFGPMKPVGLDDPRTGKRPYAVVQLRSENKSKTAYNLVGFQTKLKYGEQKKVFSLIPALKNAEFLRLGSIHRNTYICSPRLLRGDLSLIKHPQVYFAGQVTGVEGYLESAACGLLAGFFIHRRMMEQPHLAPPLNTALGTLLHYIVSCDPKNFQPTNMNYGLFEYSFYERLQGLGKKEVRRAIAEQSVENFKKWYQELESEGSPAIAKSSLNDIERSSPPDFA